MTNEELIELAELRAKAAERDGVEALRARIIASVKRAAETTLKEIAALLGIDI